MKKVVLHGKADAQWWYKQNRHRLRRTKRSIQFQPVFGSDDLKLETTPKAVTPFAGMASFFVWLGAPGFQKRVAAVIPFEYRSPNAIAPEQTLMAFISAVIVGASRFAHGGWLRHDTAFHALL